MPLKVAENKKTPSIFRYRECLAIIIIIREEALMLSVAALGIVVAFLLLSHHGLLLALSLFEASHKA